MKIILPFVMLITLWGCKTDDPITVNTDNKFIRITPNLSSTIFTSEWFLTKNTGYISTNTGKVLFTDDAGSNWLETVIDDTGTLDHLAFYDQESGLCSNSNAKVHQFSINKWNNFNFPVNDGVATCFFYLNKQNIFVTTGMNTNNESFLLKTLDGGMNWDTLYTYTGLIEQVLMLDKNTGFIIGNYENSLSVLKTKDGGSSWYGRVPTIYGTYFSNAAKIKKILAADNTNLVAIARGNYSNEGIILSSDDAGENWDIKISAHAFNDIYATKDSIYFAGDELFVASCNIINTDFSDASNLESNWNIYDRESQFLKNDKGDLVLHYDHVTDIQFPEANTGFILTKNGNQVYRIVFK